MLGKRKIQETESFESSKKQKIGAKLHLFEKDKRFPTVFDFSSIAKTLVEKRDLIRLSKSIREKKGWVNKISDPAQIQGWKDELKKNGATKRAVNYVLDELIEYYAPRCAGPIVMSLVDGVYLADNIIPQEAKASLVEASLVLDKTVGNFITEPTLLLDPSLYCFICGISQPTDWTMPWKDLIVQNPPVRHNRGLFPTGGWNLPTYLTFVPVTARQESHSSYSSYSGYDEDEDAEVPPPEPFTGRDAVTQWLPSEFTIDANGRVTLDTYINNLNPRQHAQTYEALARIFEQFVPLFNKVLTDALNQRENRVSGQIVYDDVELNDSQQFERLPIPPEIPVFSPVSPAITVDLRDRTVQVIVQMSSMATNSCHRPDWRVDGLDTERIIATGVYCYRTDNDMQLDLHFREAIVPPHCHSNDHLGPEKIFGLYPGAPLSHSLGSVSLVQDRCIVYPNLWQHRLQAQSNGEMDLLYFYLVDPATPIASTATVAPQQPGWIMHNRQLWHGTYFSLLPQELLDVIFYEYHWPLTATQATEYCDRAREERDKFAKYQRHQWDLRTFGSEDDTFNGLSQQVLTGSTEYLS